MWQDDNRPRHRHSGEVIAKFYAENVPISDTDGYPLLEQLLIHNEARIISMFHFGKTELGFGWTSLDGRFIRFSENAKLFRDKDSTIASLLASLHWITAEEDFNRFFSYQDEIRNINAFPYKHAGQSLAWSNLSTSDSSRIMSKVPYRSNAD